ncbi:hypothetical protein PHYSODRAFT_313570 [Phytophthora sojae]|uniref:Purple acid phosphatase n=1 Tax=Phytophthora sojae (strain P6497) TaxID=1094619 RepID=G4ZC60_PHYSP|nr:hypothetical protein PHYSODRAFT_313570 [Phytophthora sojae]EGZ21341.1 hypothetical protein PHYSODRAFT_313570 [Phytophthora sojae]|eukprot:XP_009524058.1 hypothetical protein PHYSODRAFT_313570 [Phytophthora sojae]
MFKCSPLTGPLCDATVTQTSYYRDDTYTMFHHHATVSGLTPHTKCFYKVGSKANPKFTSDVYLFVTARAAADNSTFSMVVYGDFGPGDQSRNTIAYVNSWSSDKVDLIYHIGDVGYADDDFLMPGQATGFYYEKVSLPYLVLVGNHEAECHSPACQVSPTKARALGNYTAYNARFKMPSRETGGDLNMWYSFEPDPIHFTSISAETDYPGAPPNKITLFTHNGNFGNQLAWPEADLKKAAANRAKVPWIIVAMHRPIYDSSNANNGVPVEQAAHIQAAFEALFIKYKVDVVLTAHEHCYQRLTPIRNNQPVLDGVSSDRKTYNNPKLLFKFCPWNVFSNYVDYGVSTLEANRSMLSWKFVSTANQAVLDQFVLRKNASLGSAH